MKKKLIIAAAIAFAVFAVPYGSSALSTVSVASENNTVAPTPAPVVDVDQGEGYATLQLKRLTHCLTLPAVHFLLYSEFFSSQARKFRSKRKSLTAALSVL